MRLREEYFIRSLDGFIIQKNYISESALTKKDLGRAKFVHSALRCHAPSSGPSNAYYRRSKAWRDRL